MYDFSVFFKKVGDNQYIFATNNIFLSYGYLVTLDEKRAIENQLHVFMKAVLAISSGCGAFMLITPKIGFPLYFSLCFLAYLHYKKCFKKIMPAPQRIYCGRGLHLDAFRKNIPVFSWLQISKSIFFAIIMVPATVSVIHQYIQQPSYSHLFLALGVLCFSVIFVCMTCVTIYTKIKQRKLKLLKNYNQR
ncbi:MAG: hypothetical protein ABSF18_03560 [Gammaproteobacteria bacterium]